MPGSVADASVLAALVFNEPRAQEAADLIGTYRLYEPTLLANELASVCRKKIQHCDELRVPLLSALEIGLRLEIDWVDVDQVAVVNMAS